MATCEQTLSDFTKEVIDSMKANNGRWEKMFGENLDAINSTTNNRYRGVNQLILSFKCNRLKYKNNIWASYKQWQSIGAQVNKGEKGTGIIFYQPSLFRNPKKDETPNTKHGLVKTQWSVMRASTVFNV